jgi:capsular exopolysaccharide synthesis family protein
VTDVVARKVKLREAIQPTPIEGLSVLQAGAASPNPSEILSGHRFARLLAAVTAAYDKIVIDSPPLGLVSDGQILAASASATVLVIRAGRSSRKASQAAAASLASVGAKVVGAILNDQPQRRNTYGYYSSYASVASGTDCNSCSTGTSDISSVARQGGSAYQER